MSSSGLTRRRAPLMNTATPVTVTKAKPAPKPVRPKPTQKRRVAVGLDDRVPAVVYTTREAADALRISETHMRKLIRRGEIGIAPPDGIYSLKIGSLRRIPIWAVEAYTRPQAEPLTA